MVQSGLPGILPRRRLPFKPPASPRPLWGQGSAGICPGAEPAVNPRPLLPSEKAQASTLGRWSWNWPRGAGWAQGCGFWGSESVQPSEGFQGPAGLLLSCWALRTTKQIESRAFSQISVRMGTAWLHLSPHRHLENSECTFPSGALWRLANTPSTGSYGGLQ